MKKKVLISTGGSGGHVLPAITIYNHLKNTHETLISTDVRGLEYLDKNYKVFVINTPKLNNYFLLPFSFLKIFNSFLEALDPISIPYPPDPWTSFTTNFSKLFITYLLSFLS